MKEVGARLLADDFIFLETPRWRDGALWTPDVFDSILYRIEPNGDRSVILKDLPPRPNSIGFLPDGSLLIVSSADRKVLRFANGELSTYADLSAICAHHLNDFAIDSDGRLYVGNFGYDLHGGEEPAKACLHFVDGRDVRVAVHDLEFPNGAVIIDGGKTLVVAETFGARLTAFDRAPDGRLSNRRLFADLDGRFPDGICADAEGGIWAPAFNTGDVVRVVEGGAFTHRLQFEGSAVACQLGGEDGKTLFCTTYAGSIDDQLAKKRLGAVYTARVDVGRPA